MKFASLLGQHGKVRDNIDKTGKTQYFNLHCKVALSGFFFFIYFSIQGCMGRKMRFGGVNS